QPPEGMLFLGTFLTGYKSLAVLSNMVIKSRDYNYKQFEDTQFVDYKVNKDQLASRAPEILRHGEAFLNTHRARPSFLWMHITDLHYPYGPPRNLSHWWNRPLPEICPHPLSLSQCHQPLYKLFAERLNLNDPR